MSDTALPASLGVTKHERAVENSLKIVHVTGYEKWQESTLTARHCRRSCTGRDGYVCRVQDAVQARHPPVVDVHKCEVL